ncbi:MAG: manganese ABC transporter ATP-binding protein [Epsilonproteobacteria bacterium]|nr:manganese ABC transporter ATP-binding protein [Campylobacterota bacterium]|tara:strand:- start:5512 stop:6270 length:759 start_codon:yes stop_codon:yes gene_type:complete
MPNQNKYIISVKDLTVAYQENPVIWDLDFYAPEKTLLGIVGPNGSGKTTLLKSILGIIKPTTGLIKIAGQSYNRSTHNIAYVPQKSSVDWNFPTDVFDVVLMGRYKHLSWFARPTKHDHEIAMQALTTMNMEKFAHRHISQLSGGQQQRVFLARALAQQANILIMDEPFVGIDITTEQLILELLQKLRSQGKTIIVVHHDLTTVKRYFDWTFLMNKKHIALGATKDVLTEQNITQTFGSSNLLTDRNLYDSI